MLTVSNPKVVIPFVGSNPFGAVTRYDVTPDGQRFFVLRADAGRPLELVQWLDVLGR